MNRLFFLLLLFLPIFSWGQMNSCHTFQAPWLVGTYGLSTGLMPGDLAFELGFIPVTLASIHYPDGSEGFMDLVVTDDLFGNTPPLMGRSVFMGNISMVADLSVLTETVTEVCFDFLDGGGVENFAVNGQDVAVISNLGELPEEVAPGVFLTIDYLGDNSNAGTLCLQGNVETLTIGGQEFGLDFFCVATVPPVCEIYNLVAEPQPCTPNGVFFVDIAFQFENAGNDGYTIFGNGNNYGTFSYNEPFPTLGPFTGDGEMIYEFIVTDVQHPDCSAAVGVGPIDCFPECELTNLSAYLNECGIQNSPYLYVDFDYANVQNLGFDLFINGEFFDFFNYDDLPLQLYDFPSADDYYIEVCENDSPACCAAAQVALIACPPDSCITFSDLEVGTQFNAENGFAAGDTAFVASDVAVSLDSFYYFNGSAGFWGADVVDNSFGGFDLAEGNHLFVSNINLDFDLSAVEGEVVSVCFDFFDGGGEENIAVNGEPVAVVSVLTDVPFEIAPGVTFSLDLAPGGSDFIQTGTACLTGPIESLTIGGQEFALDNVCFSSYVPDFDCGIFNLTAEPTDCAPNGNIYFNIDFNYENVGDNGFNVRINGGNWGSFDYGEEPVSVGPFWTNGTTDYEIIVRDIDDPDCRALMLVDTLDCAPGCGIFNLTAESLDTLAGNQTVFLVDFEYEGPLTDTFGIYAFNEPLGYFTYAELPVEVVAPCSGEGSIVLRVCDGDVFWCCATIYPEVPGCPTDDCNLSNGDITQIFCNDDGSFSLTFDFDYENTSDGFRVFTGDYESEPIGYGELPYTLELDPDAPSSGQLLICDLLQDGCCLEIPYVSDCFSCVLDGLTLTPQGCTDNGIFYVEVDVLGFHTGDTFTLFAGNGGGETYTYDDLPILLGPFLGDGQHPTHFLLEDASGDCAIDGHIEPVFCDGVCSITNLVVEPYVCVEGEFFVDVEIQAFHPGPLGYYIFADGVINGPYSYDEVFVTLGPFPGDGVTVYDFLVLDIANPACFAYEEIGPIDCSPVECSVSDLSVQVLECGADGNFTIELDFNYQNPGNDFFDFFVDGQFFDFFELGGLPLIIDGLSPGDGGGVIFEVCINDHPDCCQIVEIPAPDCENPVVWPGDANSDNIAHHFDLLNIGVAYGWQGPERNNLSIEWDAMPAPPWNPTFADGVNYAHADCNGDGVIDALDRIAILENYNLTHGPVEPYLPAVADDEDPAIFVDWPSPDPLSGGTPFLAPVVIGTEAIPVENLYGIAFTIEFDPEVIAPASVEVIYPGDGWFGAPNLNLLTVDRSFATEGRIEVAITHIDQQEMSGHGPLCMIGGIIDDIAGMATSVIEIKLPKAIRFNQTLIPLRTPEVAFDVISKANGLDLPAAEDLRVFPNPAIDQLFIQTPDQRLPDRVQLIDAHGRTRLVKTPEAEHLSLEGLPAGVYWLRIRWQGQLVTRKIIKLTE